MRGAVHSASHAARTASATGIGSGLSHRRKHNSPTRHTRSPSRRCPERFETTSGQGLHQALVLERSSGDHDIGKCRLLLHAKVIDGFPDAFRAEAQAPKKLPQRFFALQITALESPDRAQEIRRKGRHVSGLCGGYARVLAEPGDLKTTLTPR